MTTNGLGSNTVTNFAIHAMLRKAELLMILIGILS